MKKLLLPILFTACASLHERVRDQIHVGDSESQVQTLLGNPRTFGHSDQIQDGKVWTYAKGPDMCSVTFKDNLVKETSCMDNPKYKSFSEAFSEGYKNAQAQRTPSQNLHCSNDYAGGYNCR